MQHDSLASWVEAIPEAVGALMLKKRLRKGRRSVVGGRGEDYLAEERTVGDNETGEGALLLGQQVPDWGLGSERN